MVDLQAGVSPVGVQGQHITVEERQLEMAPSALNQNNDGKDYHVRAGRVHRFRPGHLDTPSSSGSITRAMTGLTGSDTFPMSASKEVTKEMKGKETEFLNRDIVDLTVDSPLQNMKRSAFALDSVSAESPEFPAFKRQHRRTSQTNRLPTLSSQSNPHQMPSEAEISVSGMRPGIRPTLRKEPSRARLRLTTSLPAGKPDTGMEPGDKATALQSEADDVLGDGQLNTGCLGASFSGRGNTTKPLPKNKGVLAHAVESHGREGEPSVATGLDCKLRGHISSEPEGLLPSKQTRPSLIDPAKTRQRFRPPRMVSSGSASGSSLGGIQRLIDVDDWETSKSLGVTKDFKIPETARQIEQDEMLAKFLQEEYSLIAGGGSSSLNDTQLALMLQEEENARQRAQPSFHANDAELAWMLQEEENAKSLQHTAQSSFHATNASAVQDARRELQRVLTPVRSLSTRPAASSSRMRILRNLQSRSNQHVMRGHQLGGRAVNASESLFHFPEGVDLDTRLEFLAAMETVLQEGFPMLAQVDRDFNENDYEMLLALDDTNHARNGVSYDRIEQLPVSVIKPTDVYEEICSICLETPVVDDVVRRLPCMHGFHQQCIDMWLEQQGNCPICKVAI